MIDNDKEREAALNAPILVEAHHDHHHNDREQHASGATKEENNEEEDKYEKRKQQEESLLLHIRRFMGVLCFCVLVVNTTFFSKVWSGFFESTQPKFVRPCNSIKNPDFEVLQSYKDYKSFQKMHNMTFIMFYRETQWEHCQSKIVIWNYFAFSAKDSFPTLGVGLMKLPTKRLQHQVNVPASSLPTCILRGDGGITMGQLVPLSTGDFPGRYLEFYKSHFSRDEQPNGVP